MHETPSLGYTNHTCEICGNSYITDMTPIIPHAYERITKEPTCTALGYTVYECKNCDYKYISDYTDKINHSYIADLTKPTCTASGYTVYTCESCGKTYTADYTATLPSEYIDELRQLAKSQQIPSVNFAIRQALDEYLKQAKKREYDEMMKAAAKDKSFMERTMKCAEDFSFSDSKVQGEW